MKAKQLGAYAILLTIVGGLITYVPPMFQGAAFILGVNQKFAEAKDQINSNTNRITKHDLEIDQVSKNIREFRAVWCLDLIQSKNASNDVVKTCTKWINEP